MGRHEPYFAEAASTFAETMVDGTKGKVGDLVERASDKVSKGIGKNVTAPANSRGEDQQGAKPMEDVQGEDRKTLRELIGRKAKSQ